MKQNDLNRAVAKATGESVSEVDRRGFQFVDSNNNPGPTNDELGCYLDWDEVERSRQESAVRLTTLSVG